MNGQFADYAVIGSTPLARLLAGLLAGVHGKRVVHIGESQSSYRLPRAIDLSVAPITRPESWSLLQQGIEETLKIVRRLAGRGGLSRVDPVFFADGRRAVEALSHVRHMAQGFGVAVEPVAPSQIGQHRVGIVLRDGIRLNRAALEPALDTWLERQGVQQMAPHKIVLDSDGSAALEDGERSVEARQTVLADDAAILAYLPSPKWPALLRQRPTSTILTTRTRPLLSPVMLEIESGILLLQQPEGGVAGIGPNGLAAFSAHMQALLGRERTIEQVGQTRFTALATLDGAPALGRIEGKGVDIVAGMGTTGVFLAPALARWIAGATPSGEAEWFGARLVTRPARSHAVTEFAPGGGQVA